MGTVSSQPNDVAGQSVAITARHMADAIGFLTRVATEAGLRNIAVKLGSVRANLLIIATRPPEKGDDASGQDRPEQDKPEHC
jgi:hypothetical protein